MNNHRHVSRAAIDWAIAHYSNEQRHHAAYVAHVFHFLFNLPFAAFFPQSRLIADLGLDDTEPEEFELALKEDGIVFPSAEFGRCSTVQDLIAATGAKAQETGPNPKPAEPKE